MPFPALSKNYCTRANIPVTDTSSSTNISRNLIWFIKAALKNDITTGSMSGVRHANSVWTCVGSSDGVTAALDGTDRWGTVSYDSTKIVSANNNSPHSWILLQNTTLGYQLLLDFCTTSVSQVRVAITPTTHPFVLAGTATHSPPVTTKSVAWAQSADSVSSTTSMTSDVSAPTVHYCSITFDDSGEFWWITHRNGIAYCTGGMALFRLIDTAPNDQYSVFLFGGSTGGGYNNGKGWPSEYPTNAMNGQSPIGTAASGGAAYAQIGSNQFGIVATFFVDDFTDKAYYWPVRVWSISPLVYRGKIPDAYNVAHAGVGASVPSVSGQTHIILGTEAIPFVGNVPLIG